MIGLSISGIICISILLGGSTVFFLKVSQAGLKLLLAFSGAYLLSVTVLNLFPEMYGSGVPHFYLGILILGGFLLQTLLEFFSHGIEHGHLHLHHHEKSSAYMVSLSLGLYIHSFLEGVPLSIVTRIEHPMLWGIVLHNIPISIAYAWMLKGLKVKPWLIFIYLVIFSVITPVGMLAGKLISQYGNITNVEPYALSLAVGIFLHISTTILFESGENHRYNYKKLGVIISAVALAVLPHLIGA